MMDDGKIVKNRGLGRGLNALFDDEEDSGFASAVMAEGAAEGGGSSKAGQMLGVEQMGPSAAQPRMDFDQEALQQLADSIQVHGILQPILVRQKRDMASGALVEGQYEIIAGERRWRAAQLAQVHQVPVIIREFDDAQAMQIALIENLQREDLNPVEEALGYQRLMDEHGYTQSELSEALGRSRAQISNMTRMLSLPESVLALVSKGDLSPGHARALVPLRDPLPMAQRVVAEGMSVREIERFIEDKDKVKPQRSSGQNADYMGTEANSLPAGGAASGKSADILALEHEISNALGMRFVIEAKEGDEAGHVRVDFKSLDQLNDVLDLLRGRALPSYAHEADVKRLLD